MKPHEISYVYTSGVAQRSHPLPPCWVLELEKVQIGDGCETTNVTAKAQSILARSGFINRESFVHLQVPALSSIF